jgi:large subunit ribosomal protein L22
METRAQLNRVRLAPRKVRAVANLIKRKDVVDALDQLEHLVRRPAPELGKLLKSAIANAENNFRMVKENLYIKEIQINEGVKLKRFMPRAQGRATEIQKKTSLISIVLDERVPGMKRKESQAKAAKEPAAHEHKETAGTKKPEIKRELGKKPGMLGGLKKMFQRKVV